MPAALRLLLSPILAGESAFDPLEVVALRLEFLERGPAPSQAILGSAVPAKIEFIGRFSATARGTPAPIEQALGELIGEVLLNDGSLGVTFTCDKESLSRLAEIPEQEEALDDFVDFSPRHLELKFAKSFEGTELSAPPPEPDSEDDSSDVPTAKVVGTLPRLYLPIDSGKYRYLEVLARLTLDGASEGDFKQNDVLDVLITPPGPQTYPYSL
jgi:hypothetical protein